MVKLVKRSLKFSRILALGLCSLIAVLLLAIGLNVPPISAFPEIAQTSGSVDQLQKQRQQLEEQRSEMRQERDRLQNLEQSAKERLGGLQNHIKATSEQIAKNETVLKQANQRLTALQGNLAKAEKLYQGKQIATVARLRFLQRQQGSKGWAVLLESQNLNEFLDRRHQLRLVYESDRTILAELKREADAIEQQRRTVENQKNEIALLTQELLAQKQSSQEQAKAQQALISRLRQDRKALEAAEAQLSQDSDSLAALIQQRLAVASGRNGVRGTGQMSFPCAGAITSSFGYRMHPILGYTRFHTGIDFGADAGSPIRAANAGTVLFAGWYGGYGQAVIIDHGNNLATLYAHASELYVSEGQTVKRGQLIAAVGSTGLSTGPHLHFEVRLRGEPVDPASYL